MISWVTVYHPIDLNMETGKGNIRQEAKEF
jgi:hypothetical protein